MILLFEIKEINVVIINYQFTTMMSSASKAISAKWTDVMVESLVDLCNDQIRAGNYSENAGFKTSSWTAILNGFNESNNITYMVSQLQSKLNELKSKFKIFQAIINNSGFGWDEENKIATTPA